MRVRTLLWRLFVATGFFLALLASAFAWLFYTETGGAWLIQRVVRAAPNEISVATLHGRLGGAFALRDISAESSGTTIKLAEINVRWHPSSLLRGEIDIDLISARGVGVDLAQSTESNSSPPPTAIPQAPLRLILRQFEITQLDVRTGAQHIAIDRIAVGVEWNEQHVSFSGFAFEAYGHKIDAKTVLTVGEEPSVIFDAGWAGRIAEAEGSGDLAITGPLSNLRFDSSIDSTFSGEVSGTLQPLLNTPTFDVSGALIAPALPEGFSLDKSRFDLRGSFESFDATFATVATTMHTGAFDLKADSSLKLSGGAANIAFRWRASPLSKNPTEIVGTGNVHYTESRITVDHVVAAPYPLQLDGHVDLGGAEPRLDLNLVWSDITYQLPSGDQIYSENGKLALKGPVENLRANIISDLSLAPIGKMRLTAETAITPTSLKLDQLRAEMLAGVVETNGNLSWREALVGNFAFKTQDIDLGVIQAGTASRLHLEGTTAFNSGAGGLSADLNISDISGYLRGQAVTGNVTARVVGDTYAIDRARLMAGSNTIEFHGTYAQALDAHFNIDIKDASVFDPRAGGTFAGRGDITGTLTRPRILGSMSGSGLHFADTTIDTLQGDIDLDVARTSGESSVTVTIAGITASKQRIDHITIAAQGNEAVHEITAEIKGDSLTANLLASGVLTDEVWNGLIETLELSNPAFGLWSLATSTDAESNRITIGGGTAKLTPLCIHAAEGHLCIEGARSGQDVNADISIAGVPLNLADHYLPRTLGVLGLLDGSASIKQSDGITTADGLLTVNDGRIAQRKRGEKTDTVAIREVAVDFELLADEIKVDIQADIERWFSLAGSLQAARRSGGPLAGEIALHSDNISWVAEFVPQLVGTDAAMMIDGKIGGTFDEPSGQANLRLKKGSIRMPDTGLDITRLEGDITGHREEIGLQASVGSGNGEARVTGRIDLSDLPLWRYDLSLKGDAFPAMRTPEIEVDVTPDLTVAGDTKQLHISGEVFVPRVFVDLKTIPPSAVRVSDDTVIVDPESKDDDQPTNNFFTDAVSGDVKLRLGDDISINGLGLSAKLSGGLDWRKKRGRTTGLANGAISIDKGVFKAYGQHMEIDNGRLHFAGAIDNPGLNLRALRPGLPVKAGVDVSGTARFPKISLYSSPKMTDGNTLAYIVTGGPLGEAGSGDASLLAQAALSLGTEESASVRNQIRNTFGLDELSVATGATARSTSLVAGKRLSPKLSVRTGFNPFDRVWSFFLNYKLTQRWSVEAESGERQGADLLYSIERETLLDGLPAFKIPGIE